MTPEEIQAKGQAKIDQLQGLMKGLKIEAQAVQRINPQGFIENVVLFMDREDYPKAPEEKKAPAPGHAPMIPKAPEINSDGK